MFELQLPTVLIWLVLSEALFAGLLCIVWNVRRAESALLYWALSSACLALGGFAVGVWERTPGVLSVSVASALLVLAWALRWAGLRRFAGQRLRVSAYLAPPLLLAALHPLPSLLGPQINVWVGVSMLVACAFNVLMMVDARRAQHREPLLMRRILILVSGVALPLQGAVILLATQTLPGEPFFVQSSIKALVLLGLLVVSALYGFGCLLMVFERYERRLVREATVDPLT